MDCMTVVTIEGADRALDAGTWLLIHNIDYEIDLDSGLAPTPRYCFRFSNPEEAIHFKLKWL
jgi:hypothetical protein